ncbi:MAG: glycosyltransferase family 2 protein [Paucimonas sp.]|nr:glycosyltransferase family 2 protein [Paucimonas sp.]
MNKKYPNRPLTPAPASGSEGDADSQFASFESDGHSNSRNTRKATFSLILATVGRTKELDRLFNSMAAQTFLNFEVIVVDQNQDARLLPHIERAISLGVVVKHVRHYPANLAAARNAGIAVATGEWLGFPDDDCWYDPHLLENVHKRFCQNDSPSGVVVNWVERGTPNVNATHLSWQRSSRFRDIPVSSITIFFQRRLFQRIGGFDARFGVGQWFGAAEETDFVLRALHEGALVAYEPSAEVHHAVIRGLPPTTPQAREAARYRARGTGALYAKHRVSPWVILRGLAAPVLRPLLKGSFGSDLAYGMAVTMGRIDGWLNWKKHS